MVEGRFRIICRPRPKQPIKNITFRVETVIGRQETADMRIKNWQVRSSSCLVHAGSISVVN